MKKYLSFILTICIVFGCASLISCNFEGIFGKTSSSTESTEPDASAKPSEQPTQPTEPTQSTTQPTEPTSSSSSTTEPEPEPEELVFEHGDNFTEEDIEFVKRFHNYRDMESSILLYSFSEMISSVKRESKYLYYANVDIKNPYYICGYIDLNVKENDYLFEWSYIDVTQYSWYKFDDKESILEEVDNLTLGWVFQIYDATIIKDIGNGVNYEHDFKFYSLGKSRVLEIIEVYEYMIIHHFEPIDQILAIKEVRKGSRIYKGHTTINGENYFILRYGNVMSADGTISEKITDNERILENYYDILYPYFERVDEMDLEYMEADGEIKTVLYYGINIEVLGEIIFRNR